MQASLGIIQFHRDSKIIYTYNVREYYHKIKTPLAYNNFLGITTITNIFVVLKPNSYKYLDITWHLFSEAIANVEVAINRTRLAYNAFELR